MKIRLSSLKEKFSKQSSYFRVCVRCGAFGSKSTQLLCRYCEARANRWRLSELQVPAMLEFPVHSLFTWTETCDSILRPILYSLKAGRCPEAVENMAKEFSWRYSGSKVKPIFFVPQSKTGELDHAANWARSLAVIWDTDEPSTLSFKDLNQAGAQKRLTAKQRSERSFIQVKNAEWPREKKVVFADDILTTGATAQAAYLALGRPPHYEVWTIAWRPKLARAERF